jgi:hypothetical protein
MALPSFVRRWMSGKGFAPPRGRQMAARPARRRPRLHLEALEDRCVPTTVMNTNDSGPDSLRQAILDTPAGGTVDFQSGLTGTITLTSGELAISKDLTITGPGASVLTVSGNHASRVFDIARSYTVGISGLTIADGFASSFGGGIENAGTLRVSGVTFERNSTGGLGTGGAVVNGGQLAVTDCTFTDNAAEFGGAIASSSSQVAVLHSTLRGNRAGNGGGGLWIYAGSLTLSDSLLADNSAVSGGGLYTTSGGTVLVERTTLTGNHTTGVGGALYDTSSRLTIDASTVADNTAFGGGGLYTYGAQVTVQASTFSGNTAFGLTANANGGAVYVSSGQLDVVNSTFAGNSARYYGGAVYSDFNGGFFTFTSSTVAGNSATYGGGLSFFSGRVTLHNTLVAANAAEDSGTTNLFAYITAESGSSYNLIGPGGSAGLVNGVNHNQIGVTDPGLGALGDHGGPTATIELLPGSPALNAGDPGLAGTLDQRGVVRRGGVNIGAYQASASALAVTAPAAVTAGTPFDLAVTAVDAFGQTAVGYTGTVTFATTDTNPAVVLPADYPFKAADAGTHTFAGGTTLVSAGSQTVTATDTAASSITGFATVAVNPAAASHLVLSDSANPVKDQAWSVTVTAYDAFGNVATGYTGTVHFTSSDGQATLPADYTFTAADAGAHTFRVTFRRLGQQSLTVTDTLDASIFGTIAVLVQNPGQDGQGQDGQ